MSKNGIDLSTYQRNVNYLSLKASGIDFAIIRSGFGKNSSQKDNLFEEHYAGLHYVGIPIGIYHYSYLTSEENAVLEARNCLEFIKNKDIELPVFLDVEEGRSARLGKEKLTNAIILFCEEIEKHGLKAGVYASLNYFNNYIDVQKIIDKGYKIWLAQYYKEPTASFKIDFWQWTSKGNVHGIEGNVDLDICYSDEFNSQPVENPVENSKELYKIGKTYVTTVDLNVRTGAGINYRIKNYRELTFNGKLHAYKQLHAVLKKGTKVTVQEIIKDGKDIWLKIPSGYIAGYYKGKIYVE